MYVLPLSQSDQRIRSVFQSVYNNDKFLTNYVVLRGQYLECSADDESDVVRFVQRAEARTFSALAKQSVNNIK